MKWEGLSGGRSSLCKGPGAGLGLVCWRDRRELSGRSRVSEGERGRRRGQVMQGPVGLGEDSGFYPEGRWEPMGLDPVWGSA